MQNSNKKKLFFGLIYIIILISFLIWFFSLFSLEDISSYDFIKDNSKSLEALKNENLFFIFFVLLFSCAIWVLLAGFLSPIALMSGFVLGKYLGTICVVIGSSLGATFLYILGKYFFYDIIKNKFSQKYEKLEEKFKKNEFLYFIIYRFIGGIPFAIANILPVLFNVKKTNYFFGTLLGIMPQLFIFSSLGSGLDEIIKNNASPPSIVEIITSPSIHIPIIAFIFLVVIISFLKKKIN